MPLNIPASAEVEPKEVREFKTKVETIAKRYAKQHNLCSVVDKALAEMGVGKPADPINVTVEVMVPVTMVIEMDKGDFAGKTPEEEAQIVAAHLSKTGNLIVDSNITRPRRAPRMTKGDLDVRDVSEWTPEPTQVGTTVVPSGYEPRFTSDQGRVSHLLTVFQAEEQRRGRYAAAACGASSYYWTSHSYRDEGRVCQKCMDRT